MKEKYCCLICPKEYTVLEELLHHMNLDHIGISSESLDESSKARETKKQLGDYVGENSKEEGTSLECPECFEIFSDMDKLDEHRKAIHKMRFTSDARKKLKELSACDEENPPQCEKCTKFFYGLVICKMDGNPCSVCLNCYENHFGVNALRRLTIGTPDDILDTMRREIKK